MKIYFLLYTYEVCYISKLPLAENEAITNRLVC
nr:MAG TPA: hypothetical protein [Caudoviricetes sp.]